ncbi:MAG: hypothetical protein COA79_11765 [Planctomycetota bacterium]|nr:MAG: hypothetical protein COA79_11765 [Planctomycetota bacterium]
MQKYLIIIVVGLFFQFNELYSIEKYFLEAKKIPKKVMGISFSHSSDESNNLNKLLMSEDLIVGLDGKRIYNLHEWNHLRFTVLNRKEFNITVFRKGKFIKVIHKPEILLSFYKFNPSDKVEDVLSTLSESTIFEKSSDDSENYFLKGTKFSRAYVLEYVGQLPGKVQEEIYNLNIKEEKIASGLRLFLEIYLNIKLSRYDNTKKLLNSFNKEPIENLNEINELLKFYSKVIDKPVFNNSIKKDYDCTINYYLMNYPFPINEWSSFKGIFLNVDYNKQLKSFISTREVNAPKGRKRFRNIYFGNIVDAGDTNEIMTFVEYLVYSRFLLNRRNWGNHITNEFYSNDEKFKEIKETILKAKPFFGLSKSFITFSKMLIHASDFNKELFENELKLFIKIMGKNSLPYLSLLIMNDRNGFHGLRAEAIKNIINENIKSIPIHPLYLKFSKLTHSTENRFLYYMTGLRYGKIIDPANKIYKDSIIFKFLLDELFQKKISKKILDIQKGKNIESVETFYDYLSKEVLINKNVGLSIYLEGMLYLTDFKNKYKYYLRMANMCLELKLNSKYNLKKLSNYFLTINNKYYEKLFESVQKKDLSAKEMILSMPSTPLLDMMKGTYFDLIKDKVSSQKYYKLGRVNYKLMKDYLVMQSRKHGHYDTGNVHYEKLAFNNYPNIFDDFYKKKNQHFMRSRRNDNIVEFIYSKLDKNTEYELVKDKKLSLYLSGVNAISLFNGKVYKNINRFKYDLLDYALTNFTFDKTLFGNQKNDSIIRSAYSLWLFKPQIKSEVSGENFENFLDKLGSNNYFEREKATIWLIKNKNSKITDTLKTFISKSNDLESIDRAKRVLKSIVTPDEHTFNLNFAKAYFYLNTGDYKKFRSFFDTIDKSKNLNNIFYLELSKVYFMSKGELKMAMTASENLSVLKKESDDKLLKSRISLLLSGGFYKEAIAILENKELMVNSDYKSNILIECYNGLCLFDKAQSKINEINNKNPRNKYSYNNFRVRHNLIKGDFNQIIKLFEKEQLLYKYNRLHPYVFSLMMVNKLDRAIKVIKSKTITNDDYYQNDYIYTSLIHIQLYIFLKLNGEDAEANYLLNVIAKIVEKKGLDQSVFNVFRLFQDKLLPLKYLNDNLSNHHFKRLKEINERQFFLGFFFLLKKEYKTSMEYFNKCQSSKIVKYKYQAFARMIVKTKLKSLFSSK